MQYAGLSSDEVKKLQAQRGLNVLPSGKSASAIKIFLAQFANPLIYLLVFVGAISIFLQKYLDIVFIFSVVFLNSIFGFFQEYKTQKTFQAVKKLLKPMARVVRDGQQQTIEAFEVVFGDIALVSVGDKIPADSVVLEAVNFFVDEAILTGESKAIAKKENDEVFMATIVASGRAVLRVAKIGSQTKVGEIAKTLKETVQPPTTLQLRLKKLTHVLIYVAVFLSALVYGLGLFTGQDFWQITQTAAVLLVAIIPEALIIVITLILVIAMQKTLKRKALIRKLLAVETLGSVTTICTDKTGTLTEGKMKVSKTDFTDQQKGLLVMGLCNDLSDTLEVACRDFLEKQEGFNLEEVLGNYKRISEVPFSSEHKFMATVNYPIKEDGVQRLLLVKGAPEIVLAMSDLSEQDKKIVLNQTDAWAITGLKVLGLGFAEITNDQSKEVKVNSLPPLKWAGMVGFWDPPRQEVKEAFLIARQAGIKIKVVTGDYRRTAENIMAFLGLPVMESEVLEGSQFETLNEEEFKDRVAKAVLFARITPHQKLMIVKALQDLGEVVAMTGDGVNDAPALKKSNIGIVVGTATEVAKETADLILLDSNFKTIVAAVEEGRVVFENIKKTIFFMLSNSFAEVFLILGSIFLGWPMPLTIIQILWIHFICDGPEDLVLGFEPKEDEVMADGPKSVKEPILDKARISLIFLISFLSGMFALTAFWYFGLYQKQIELGRTMALMAIAFTSVLYIFCCRTFRHPFWRYKNFWSNKWLFSAVAFSLTLQISITYLPFTQKFLGVVPLNLAHWGLLLFFAGAIVLLIESAKMKVKS
ncbi:MAG: HAD-IC family P-type ATPase [Patescibacteria group bacterium]